MISVRAGKVMQSAGAAKAQLHVPAGVSALNWPQKSCKGYKTR